MPEALGDVAADAQVTRDRRRDDQGPIRVRTRFVEALDIESATEKPLPNQNVLEFTSENSEKPGPGHAFLLRKCERCSLMIL
jgi:hypothetical protein